jgi:hypothetical protein
MEKNENKQEKVSNKATMEVNSSITLDAALLVTCRDVITKRQNPSRFADVGKICWDVLLAISIKISHYLISKKVLLLK